MSGIPNSIHSNSGKLFKILWKSKIPLRSFVFTKSVCSMSPENIIFVFCPTLVMIVSNSWKFKFWHSSTIMIPLSIVIPRKKLVDKKSIVPWFLKSV